MANRIKQVWIALHGTMRSAASSSRDRCLRSPTIRAIAVVAR
jgi:hypothetical protein